MCLRYNIQLQRNGFRQLRRLLVPSLRKLPFRVRKAIGLYPQPDKFGPRPSYFSVINCNVVPPTSGHPNSIFPSGFPTKTLYTILFSPFLLHALTISSSLATVSDLEFYLQTYLNRWSCKQVTNRNTVVPCLVSSSGTTKSRDLISQGMWSWRTLPLRLENGNFYRCVVFTRDLTEACCICEQLTVE
jgi:hypothetical protein